MDKKGKLIVIDGSDGSGKATQTKLLVARLLKEKILTKTLDFPQYTKNFFGQLLKECLSGTYGDFIAVNPRIASVLYAADRFESKDTLERWLKEGKVVVLDRYVSANQMHQGGKIKDARGRKAFLSWLDTMEHTVFTLPRPNMILYLHVPVAVSQVLLKDKRKDLAEKNIKYLSASQEGALKLIRAGSAWKKIECTKRGAMLQREEIHEKIYAQVKKVIGV